MSYVELQEHGKTHPSYFDAKNLRDDILGVTSQLDMVTYTQPTWQTVVTLRSGSTLYFDRMRAEEFMTKLQEAITKSEGLLFG